MEMTLVEKVIALHADRERVEPGDRVTVKADRFLLDAATFHDLGHLPRASKLVRPPNHHQKIVVALDQFVSGGPEDYIAFTRAVRDLAAAWRIHNLYDLGRGGIDTSIFPDGGLVRPGDIVVAGRSRLCALGGLGALVFTLEGEALLDSLMSGTLEVTVPSTYRVDIEGTLPRWVGGKDIAYRAMDTLEIGSLNGKALEFAGTTVRELDVPERLALSAAGANLPASQVLVEPDEKSRVFARARNDRFFRAYRSESGATFEEQVTWDATMLEPYLARPESDPMILPLRKAGDLTVHQVILGTGGNGRIEDLRAAAAILREYQVNSRVRCILVPGSQQVLLHGMEESLFPIFARAGVHIAPPSEGYADRCHLEGTSPDEVCLSTAGFSISDAPRRRSESMVRSFTPDLRWPRLQPCWVRSWSLSR